MLKLLLILVLVTYALYKLGLFRVFIHQAKEGYRQNPPKTGGNVNINSTPPKQEKRSGLKGGDYIDYEEIK